MHQPVRDGLEDYLAGKAQLAGEFHAHLRKCSACAAELQVFEQQSQLFRALRPGDEVEPGPGFYARVMDRVEKRASDSIWAALLVPAFGRRIAMASAALTVLIGVYMFSTEPGDRGFSAPSAILSVHEFARQTPPAAATEESDRDAVLFNLASFQDN